MIGLAFALAINFKGAKAQAKAVSNHAAAALSTPMILLTTGVFIGVLKNTKMMDAMANMLIGIMPQAIGSHLPIFIGALSGPIGMMLGTDSFFFGFMPLVLGVGEKFAASAHDIAGVSIKEHLKFCTPYLWILSWITLAVAALIGIVGI